MVWVVLIASGLAAAAAVFAYAAFSEGNQGAGSLCAAVAALLLTGAVVFGLNATPDQSPESTWVRGADDLQPGVFYEMTDQIGKGGAGFYVVIRDEEDKSALYLLPNLPPKRFFLRLNEKNEVEIFSSSPAAPAAPANP